MMALLRLTPIKCVDYDFCARISPSPPLKLISPKYLFMQPSSASDNIAFLSSNSVHLCAIFLFYLFLAPSWQYATSCPADLGGNFGRPPGSKLNSSMSVLEEATFDEEEEGEKKKNSEIKTATALSILESFAGQTGVAHGEGPDVDDTESMESSVDSERLPIQEDVFELEGLEGVSYT